MQTMQTKAKTVLWILAVYIFSFVCYVPMMLKQLGIRIPDVLLYLKYCFVLVPALISVIVSIHEHNLKTYFTHNLKKISLKELIICIVIALLGVLITYCYSFVKRIDLFGNAYSSIFSLVIGVAYLFATALVEEIAWRGFLFKRIADGGKRGSLQVRAAAFVGIIWAIWHIPMWLIRNSLSLAEMLPLFIWAVLISIVLGMLYCRFRNIFSVSLLHMIFNICFLAPTGYNIIMIFLGIIILQILLGRKNN